MVGGYFLNSLYSDTRVYSSHILLYIQLCSVSAVICEEVRANISSLWPLCECRCEPMWICVEKYSRSLHSPQRCVFLFWPSVNFIYTTIFLTNSYPFFSIANILVVFLLIYSRIRYYFSLRGVPLIPQIIFGGFACRILSNLIATY